MYGIQKKEQETNEVQKHLLFSQWPQKINYAVMHVSSKYAKKTLKKAKMERNRTARSQKRLLKRRGIN